MARKPEADTTPAWLREELVHDNEPSAAEQGQANKKPAPQPPVYGQPPAAPAAPAANAVASAAGVKLPTQEDVPRLILYTRVINLFLSIGMLLASLLSLLTTTDATTGVLACYTVAFGCLLCCYETHLKQISKLIAKNFGFLYSAKSRCVFMLFIGTIMFSFSLFGKLIGILMLANAAFNGFLLCMYPAFDEMQRKDAQAEIQDFLSANPAYAAQAVSLGVSAGAHIAKENPDLARQGMSAMLQSQSGGSKYAQVNQV